MSEDQDQLNGHQQYSEPQSPYHSNTVPIRIKNSE